MSVAVAVNGGTSTPRDLDSTFDDATLDAPISVADTGDASDSGKLKLIVQLIKKCFGVTDIANARLSLPSQLIYPSPNLDYWSYADRPDIFASINDSPDPFERMLAVVRFAFSKDLKFVRGGVVKPYNSVLGEHFRCQWRIPALPNPPEPEFVPRSYLHIPTPAPKSETGSVRSFTSRKSATTVNNFPVEQLTSKLESVVVTENGVEGTGEEAQVVFITEQVSHHPPISSFYYEAVERGVQMTGVDQIAARLSGASVRIAPGDKNKGIFIKLTSGFGEGEQYHITHPIAAVNGLLTLRLYPSITDSVIITCSGGKDKKLLRAIIEYKDEGWIGRPQRAVEGCIHTYDPESTEHLAWRKVRQVPANQILATFVGAWDKKIEWKRPSETESRPLIDLSQLSVVPKLIRPIPEQMPTESWRYWDPVTKSLLRKDYREATNAKLTIEQRQREIAADRKRKGVHFTPVYFDQDIEDGTSKLSAEGLKAIREEVERTVSSRSSSASATSSQ